MLRRLFVVLVLGTWSGSQAAAGEYQAWIDRQLPGLVELYQHFHQNPELSQKEEKTAKRLGDEIQQAGFVVHRGIGGHGLVALLENGAGPTVMFRGDMDALPVTERTGLPYASQVTVQNDQGTEVGVMHACGHDIHITHLVGLARFLAEHKHLWRGTAMLIGQPAEEHGAGARRMLDDGAFTRFPKPNYGLAIHCDSRYAAGNVGYISGYSHANVNAVHITMKGRGGHGSAPQSAIDPIVMSAQLILDLQTIVSREISAFDEVVITVGAIHGGTKNNIIPDQCDLQVTVRTRTDELREHVLAAIERKAKAVAMGARAPEPTVRMVEGTPALFNDQVLTRQLLPVLRNALGKDRLFEADKTMGGEDFSEFGRAGVPVCMLRVGAVRAERLKDFDEKGIKPPSLHAGDFYPDAKESLDAALTASTAAVLSLFGKPALEPGR